MNHQKEKAKFRTTGEWKQFKADMKKFSGGTDALTGKPLRKGAQLHHLDLRQENYRNLDAAKFIYLNRASHEAVHFLYTYYRKDPAIIYRLQNILYNMKEASDENRSEKRRP